MHKTLTALLALVISAGLAFAQDGGGVRSDLTPKDLERVRAVTAPTQDFSKPERFELLPAGAATTKKLVNRDSFSLPSANLSFEQQERFNLGNGFFTKLWVSAPSSTKASDGLGPLFNSRGCQNCHLKDGRGHPPFNPGESSESMFLRLSVPATTAAQKSAIANHETDVIAEPTYGTQLQESAVPGLRGEGHMQVTYEDVPVTLGDGTVVTLRKPTYSVADLGYGPMAPDVMLSPRVTPQMIGLGLLEAVPVEDILANADPGDRDGDGVSGKPNWVHDPVSGKVALGRFGWKAGAPSIRVQAAHAFAGDLGISTPLVNQSFGDCTANQQQCLSMPTGDNAAGESEAPDPILDLVTFYSQNLGVPQRRGFDDPKVLAGKQAFYEAGCATCHVPKFVTSRKAEVDALRFQLIWPYSDLLLHDMGDGLADLRPEGDAHGYEWRTPPLWGIGLTETISGHTLFLHDGRARSLTEAVLWHGGEAQKARDAFTRMTKTERDALIAFLESL
ncbi:thiol oxidoreductase [Youhaiella tibetensis]|nr:di-heme oxidoredictase family protein [Youhaiella tibetensis]GGF12626.1 thiol oxidoreductase [Youhaiella tibetensis]